MTEQVTRLLVRWREGDSAALDRLLPMVYDELRRMARGRMQREAPGHTLQATELVHEAYARLVDADVDWVDRAHFLAIAATTMRRVLVDHARTRARLKRGGGEQAVTLAEDLVGVDTGSEAFLALDGALTRLAAQDERKARVVELHYFGGLTYAETAAAVGVSEATIDRDLRMARAWLKSELERDGGSEAE